MLYSLGARRVRLVGEGHFVAPSAQVMGDVILEASSSVWFGAVIRGDNDQITVGEGSNIQDGAVLHTDPGYPLVVGKDVTVGHQAMLHGCQIGEGALIGIQAVILNGARIGKESLVGAKSLVPEGMEVPEGVLVMGTPAKVRRELTEDERRFLRLGAQHYAAKARTFSDELQEQSL